MTNPKPTQFAQEPVRADDRATLDALGRELDDLLAVQTAATARIGQIKARLATLDFGNHLAGDLKVSIQHNVTRDSAAFEADYPFEAYPDFYKPVLDTKVVNDALSPAEVRKYQREGTPKVIVTKLEG